MYTTLTVHCPLCGTPLKILDTIPAVRTNEGAVNISICRCGVFEIIVRQNKVTAIRLRNPEQNPDLLIRDN